MDVLLRNVELNLGWAYFYINFNELFQYRLIKLRVMAINLWVESKVLFNAHDHEYLVQRLIHILINESIPMTSTEAINSKNCYE